MHRTWIKDAKEGLAKVQGFVEHIRNTRRMGFIVLRDRTGKLQITIEKGVQPILDAVLEDITIESTLTVQGTVVRNDSVKLSGMELLPTSIVVESIAAPIPLLSDSGIDARLDYRYIDLRTEANQLLMRVQSDMLEAMRGYLRKHDFTEIHTPKLIGTASESGADVFSLQYFDRKAYLSQSPQFYKQMAMAGGMERIFEVGPVFRAEKSHTRRHATEFTGLDVEMSFIDSYADVIRLQSEMLSEMLASVQESHGAAIARLFGQQVIVPTLPFPQITLSDLYAQLESRYGFTVPEAERGDLSTEAEQLASRYALDVYGHAFLFVTDFSAENRAFYHMRKDGMPQGYDLLWRGVEITTGAQREHRYAQLKAQAEEKGLSADTQFYLEFFRYGCPPHGGFGLGLDRLTMLLLGISIKEAMFLFRGPNRLTP